MPHVINGIGTWYYGKQDIHRLRGICQNCKAATGMESYNTTLYFVVFFVPLVPLARKRIVESCPKCSWHKSLPLREWNRLKSEAIGNALAKIRDNPNDRDAMLGGIRAAAGFQDEPLFDKLSDGLAGDRTDDPDVQVALGDGYSYFARHQEAAAAYVNALKVRDDPRVREQLGLTFLRLGDPARAAGCFDHILDEADQERLWMPYFLIGAYQSQGMHTEALVLIDRMVEKFPPLEQVKDVKKLRAVSVKDAGRNRPVGKSMLEEARAAGTHEGNRFGNLIPKLILPLLIAGVLVGITVRSLMLAEASPVYVVNGSPVAYTVKLNDVEYRLPAGSAEMITLPEGVVTIAPGPGGEGIEPGEVTFGSSFFARPFDSTTVVINPDRMAILEKETTVYAENPPPPSPPEYQSGEPLYEFDDIDHPFQEFPPQIKAKKNETVTRRRVGLVPIADGPNRLLVVLATAGPDKLPAYARRWAMIAPDDPTALTLFATLSADEALKAFRHRLADRPVRVELHRIAQTLRENAGEDRAALRAEYAALADETGRDPDVLYLLSRVSEPAEGEAVLREAVASGKPAERAHYSLGFRRICETKYLEGYAELKQAPTLSKIDVYRTVFREALLATNRFAELREQLGEPGDSIPDLIEQIWLLTVMDANRYRGQIEQYRSTLNGQLLPDATAEMRTALRQRESVATLTATADFAGYAKLFPGTGKDVPYQAMLIRGDWKAADETADDNAVSRGLVLLATPETDAAAAKTAFLDALGTSIDPDEKQLKDVLAAGTADPVGFLRDLHVRPEQKRVYVAAAATWFPDRKAELFALAKTLDFHRDETSLVLAKYLPPKPAGKK